MSTFNRVRGEDTEPTKGTAYGVRGTDNTPVAARSVGPAAKPATEQKEPVNMPAQVGMENTGGSTLEGAPRQNLFRADRPESAIPPKKLSRFDKFRQAAFPAAAQE